MRFLHIADLHIGKRLNDVSFLEDQRDVLKQIAQKAVEHKVDAVLIAGDVYQKSSPQSEAMTLFNDFVTELVGAGIKVFVISGNHDSDQRISYFSALLRKSDVFVSEVFTGALQTIELEDEYGALTVSLLPFIRPSAVRHCFPDEKVATYQDAAACVLAHSGIDTARRNVLIAHQTITDAATCDSEELSIGGLDNIDASLFDDFDYVALGHLHGPQHCGRETCRYAGSPLKYSFSEVDHVKSAALVELREKGKVSVELLPLKPRHEMRVIKGGLEEIMAMDYSEDYVQVIVTDETVKPDARVDVSTVFPNMMKFGIQNSRTKEDRDVLARDLTEEKDTLSLFEDFYRVQNNNQPMPDSHARVLREILKKMGETIHEAD